MKERHSLAQLLCGSDAVIYGAPDVALRDIAIHSKGVAPASVFVAVSGVALDGHDYLHEAVQRGAAALVVEDATRVPAAYGGAVAVVPNARVALNQMANRFFGAAGDALYCVAITGTDGKSTVAWMVEAVLAGCGTPTGVIGTIDHHFRHHTWPGDTTPPPLRLQERLSQFRRLGARAAVLEATSQGLSQSRITSVPLDVAVFTNLGHDHLDYHQSLDAYFEAKSRLFSEVLASTTKASCHALLNIDTPFGARIPVPANAERFTYGDVSTNADLRYEVLKSSLHGSDLRFHHGSTTMDLRLPMFGAFNAANAAAAIGVGLAAGHELGPCVEALRGFAGVPGRMERVGPSSGRHVFVDYAHDPHAFNLLLPAVRKALRRARSRARLVTVFGCGGDRDRAKRPLMLQAALRWSDAVFLTSDNSRSESPEAIADDALAGADDGDVGAELYVELDRERAIHRALAFSDTGDVVLILGKGHERYHITGDGRSPYAGDAAVARAFLEDSLH